MNLLPLIFRNLLRSRRRTLLTVVSIAISIFVFAALMSLPAVIESMTRASATSLRLVTSPKAGFFYQMPFEYRRRIEGIPHVDAVAGELLFMGTYRNPSDLIPSVAIDTEHIREMFSDWAISQADADELNRVRSGALVGGTLMRRFGWRIGQKIILHGSMQPTDVELTIVGTAGGAAPPIFVMFRRDYLDEILGRPGTVNVFWVKVDSREMIPQTIAAIDEQFANAPMETKTQTEEVISSFRLSMLRTLLNGAKALALIVIIAVGLVAANTAAMAMRERRHELAVMCGLGFQRTALIWMLVSEGLLVSLIGGLSGTLLAWGVLHLLPYAAGRLGVLAMVIALSRPVVIESLAVALVIGLASSLVPASAAVRGDVGAALRAIA